MGYTCPECGGTKPKTHPGEHGYGVHVHCGACGFPLDYCTRIEYHRTTNQA